MTIALSSLRIEASLDASAYVAGAKAKADADARMVETGNQVATSLDTTERRLTTSASGWDRFRKSIGDTSAYAADFERGQSRIQGALDAGRISADEAARLMGLLRQRYYDAEGNLKSYSRALGTANEGHAALSTQSQSAMHAIRGFTEQVALGVSPLQALTAQANHLSYAATGPGGLSGALRGVGGLLASIVTPTTAAIAGLTALAAGFALVLSRASQTEAQIRAFGVALRASGNSGLATPQDLLSVQRGLESTGSPAAEAAALTTAAARVPGINPASYGELATLARDIAAGTGQQATAVIAGLEKALTGGADAAAKFVYQLAGPNGLTAAEAASMRAMAAQGDAAGAAQVAIEALQRRYKGLYEEGLSPSQKAVERLTDSYHKMLDALAESGPIQKAQKALTDFFNSLADAARGKSSDFDVFSRIGDLFSLDFLTAQGGMGQSGNVVARAAIPAAPSNFSVAPGVIMSGQADAFSDMLSHAAAQLPPGYGLVITSIGRPNGSASPVGMNSAHVLGNAVDFQIIGPNGERLPNTGTDTTGLYGQTYRNVLAYASSAYPSLAATLRSGATFGANGGPIGAGSPADIGHIDLRGGAVSGAVSQQDLDALAKAREQFDRASAAARKFGDDELYAKTYTEALANSSLTGNAKIWEAEQKASQAVELHRIELQKQAQLQDQTTAGVLKTAAAYQQDEVAGYRAAATAAAELAVKQGEAIDVASKAQEILRSQAAEAINAAAQQIPALQRQTAETGKLAAAAKEGAAAEHEAAIENQAAAATHDALAKAIAAGDPVLIERAKALQQMTEAQLKANDAAQSAKAIYESINQRSDQIAIAQLQIGMQGQTPEAIAAATASLQEQQKLRASGVSLSGQVAKDDLASVDALSKANAQLQEAQREQQRIDDGIRNIASTVDNTLTTAIQNAFNGQRVTDWGATIKSMLASIVAQISDALFIKPLIGSVISAFGFGSAAQSFGTFGSLFGGGGGSAGAGNVVGVLTQNSSGGFSLSTLANGASLLSSVSGGGLFGSLFGKGGFTGWLNDIGGNFGFFKGTPYAANGLFGGTTFTQFLGGAGAGFAAGSLLNSLLGGNQLIGTIGSGLGGLVGAAIGSIVPGIGTLLGGILGGAGGGLFGLFGNTKPPNNESAATLDLASGRISGVSSHGIAANDQQLQQYTQTISEFTKSIQQATGGTITGSVIPDIGSRDGIQLNYNNVPGLGTGKYVASSLQDAIDKSELAIARGLQGVSDTVRTVLNAITDPSQIQAALQFAATYDDLKKAADSAFSSISSDTDQVGPFAQALDQLNAIFKKISDQATQFGLSLDPVNKALAAAKERLSQDFDKSISDAILAITDPVQLAIEQENQANAQRLADAKAVNGNIEQVDRLHALIIAQIGQQEIDTLKQQLQSLAQLRDELTSGSLSGLTPAASVRAANDNFLRELALVQGGNLAEAGNLATAGTNVVQLSQQAYGNAPQTSALRTEVLSDINAILQSRGFASGTASTPPGWIMVGERGPEWLFQPGGATVLPNGQMPPANTDLAAEIRALRADVARLLAGGNRIAQAVGAATVARLDAVREGLDKRAPAEVPRRAVA